jgi:hypothetical protein
VCCFRDSTADVREGAKMDIRESEGEDGDEDLFARREVASAARRIPKIAPRVPPMSSTASMMARSRVSTDPDFAAPESKILRIARWI